MRHSHQKIALKPSRAIAAFSRRYCGICCTWRSVLPGGVAHRGSAPMIGSHWVIERPEPVSRVSRPPPASPRSAPRRRAARCPPRGGRSATRRQAIRHAFPDRRFRRIVDSPQDTSPCARCRPTSKKLIGTLVTLVWLFVYVLIAMGIGAHVLRTQLLVEDSLLRAGRDACGLSGRLAAAFGCIANESLIHIERTRACAEFPSCGGSLQLPRRGNRTRRAARR